MTIIKFKISNSDFLLQLQLASQDLIELDGKVGVHETPKLLVEYWAAGQGKWVCRFFTSLPVGDSYDVTTPPHATGGAGPVIHSL